jgi:hypothetical protein
MKTASKKAHYKRLKNYCELRKKQKESSQFSRHGFPVPFSRPGFPVLVFLVPDFREQILENKFFVSDFGRKKTKVPGSGLENGNGKIRVLNSYAPTIPPPASFLKLLSLITIVN